MKLPMRWLVLTVLWAFSAAQAAPPGADDVVRKLHSVLLEVMQEAESLGYAGRYAKLDPVLREAFDLADIVRIAVGSHWGSFTAEEREGLTDTFSRLTVATYTSRFDGYSGETFTLDEVSDMKRGRKLVRTRLVKASGQAVRLDYVLQPEGEAWKIVNVVADGVSDLSLKRAEYTAIVETEGLTALLDKLDEKIRGYEAGSP